MRSNPYLSRPVGSKEPFSLRRRVPIVAKQVSIGNQPADTRLHHAVASNQWMREEELYDNRRRKPR